MSDPFRFSIATLMGLVVIAAIGAAIFRQGLEASAAVAYLVTGRHAMPRDRGPGLSRQKRAGVVARGQPVWVGLLEAWAMGMAPSTEDGLAQCAWAFHRISPDRVLVRSGRASPGIRFWSWASPSPVLVVALLRGFLASALMGVGVSRSNEATTGDRPPAARWPGWWARPTIVLATGFVLVITSCDRRTAPGLRVLGGHDVLAHLGACRSGCARAPLYAAENNGKSTSARASSAWRSCS